MRLDVLIVGIMFISLNLLILNKIIKRRTRNDLTFIFNSWWVMWLLISFVNIGKFYPITMNTYIYILTGILFVNMPFIFFKKNKLSIKKYGKMKKLKYFYFNEIIFFIINLYYIAKLFNLIDILNDYRIVRTVFFGIEDNGIKLFSNALYVYIYNFFKSLSIASFLISLSLVFKRKKYILFLSSIINLTLFCFLSAGRDFITYILIFLIFSFKTGVIKKSFKYIAVLLVPVLITTFLREGNLKKLGMIIVTYFSGSIAYFNEVMKQYGGKFYYGELFFSFLISPLKYVLIVLKVSNNKGAMIEVGEKLMHFIQISSENTYSQVYNALATMFYWFYADLGYLGIILFSSLIGYIGLYIQRRVQKNYIEHMALAAYFEYLMIMSIFSNKFMDIFSVFPLMVYLFLLKKERVNKR